MVVKRGPLFVMCCVLVVVDCCLSFVVCGSLLSLFVVRGLLTDVCGLLRVVCCWCCALFADGWYSLRCVLPAAVCSLCVAD